MGAWFSNRTVKSTYVPFEEPRIGEAPSYAEYIAPSRVSAQATAVLTGFALGRSGDAFGAPGTQRLLRGNVDKISRSTVGSSLRRLYRTAALSFLSNQGVGEPANYPHIWIMLSAADAGAFLAEAEYRSRYANSIGIEKSHIRLYAEMRNVLTSNDKSDTGWAGYIYDVCYYCQRTGADLGSYFGPLKV